MNCVSGNTIMSQKGKRQSAARLKLVAGLNFVKEISIFQFNIMRDHFIRFFE